MIIIYQIRVHIRTNDLSHELTSTYLLKRDATYEYNKLRRMAKREKYMRSVELLERKSNSPVWYVLSNYIKKEKTL